jgi:hypothetical protein
LNIIAFPSVSQYQRVKKKKKKNDIYNVMLCRTTGVLAARNIAALKPS